MEAYNAHGTLLIVDLVVQMTKEESSAPVIVRKMILKIIKAVLEVYRLAETPILEFIITKQDIVQTNQANQATDMLLEVYHPAEIITVGVFHHVQMEVVQIV